MFSFRMTVSLFACVFDHLIKGIKLIMVLAMFFSLLDLLSCLLNALVIELIT